MIQRAGGLGRWQRVKRALNAHRMRLFGKMKQTRASSVEPSGHAAESAEAEQRYVLSELVEELDWTFGDAAPKEAVDLLLQAHERGLDKQFDVFASAAIILCYRRHLAPANNHG